MDMLYVSLVLCICALCRCVSVLFCPASCIHSAGFFAFAFYTTTLTHPPIALPIECPLAWAFGFIPIRGFPKDHCFAVASFVRFDLCAKVSKQVWSEQRNTGNFERSPVMCIFSLSSPRFEN